MNKEQRKEKEQQNKEQEILNVEVRELCRAMLFDGLDVGQTTAMLYDNAFTHL